MLKSTKAFVNIFVIQIGGQSVRNVGSKVEVKVVNRPFGNKSRLTTGPTAPKSPAENRALARRLEVRMVERGVRSRPGVGPTKRALQQQIRVAALKGDYVSASSLFREYRSHGHKPDTYVFDQLLLACAARGDVNQAFKVYNMMKKHGARPGIYTINIMIDAYANADPQYGALHMERAHWLFKEEMARWGIQPSIETYHVLLKCYLRQDSDPNFDSVWELIREMKSQGLVPDAVTYASWMQCFRRKSNLPGGYVDLRKVLDVWEEMKRNHVYPDLRAYNVLLSLCRDASKQDRSLGIEVYRDMRRDGIQPDKRSLQMVLQIAGTVRKQRFACQLFDEHFGLATASASSNRQRASSNESVSRESHPPGPSSPKDGGSGKKHSRSNGDFLSESGVLIDQAVCSAFIRVCSQVSSTYVSRLEKFLASRNIPIGPELSDTIIAVLSRSGKVNEALSKFLSRAEHIGPALSAHSVSAVLEAPTLAHYDSLQLTQILQATEESNISLDSVLIRSLQPLVSRLDPSELASYPRILAQLN